MDRGTRRGALPPAGYPRHVTAPADRPVDWPKVRLHVVTGKGGTGKSTVAAALALALAGSGRNVLLCEVEGRQGIARMFDVDPLPYEERRITKGAPDEDGRAGQVHALHIDAESALLEYLAMYYKLGRAGKALDRFGVIDFATTIAPGVRDVLLTGKVYEAVQRPRGNRNREQITYDAVVLDAPPTGRICQFLGVNSELAGLAKVGPIKSQADKVMELLRSPRTAVHLVTILEEMPVQETSDGIAELRAAGLPVGGIVVNLVRPQALSAGALAQVRDDAVDPTAITSDLARARVDVDAALVESLVAEARDHAVRRQLEDEQRALVAAEGLPTYELPRIAAGIDHGALVELAQLLRTQGMA
jgi:anion-transporting  ArsA/GET3 family ATPase